MYIKKRWDNKTRLKYARKIEEYIAINDLTIGRAVQDIGINTQIYYRLMGGLIKGTTSINPKSQKIIEAFFNNIESE